MAKPKSPAEIISYFGVATPRDIDLDAIAFGLKAEVRYRALVGCEARIVGRGERAIITVNTGRSRTRQRFSIGHELGHWMRHRGQAEFFCSKADLAEHRSHGPKKEAVANSFAAELLMPTALFRPCCELSRPSLHEFKPIAEEFDVSLTAAAIRFLQFTPEPAAVVQSTNGVVDWAFRGPGFDLWIEKGRGLDTRTFAYDVTASSLMRPDRMSLVEGDAWSDSDRAQDAEVYEHSLVLGSYGSVLTLLIAPRVNSGDEWEGVEDMTDGFRFRK